MKTTVKQWIAAGIVATLAGPGWAQINNWQCVVGPACFLDPASQYWINPANWTLGGPPLSGQDVRITPTYGGVLPVNYAAFPPGQIFNSVSIDGMTLNHPTFDPSQPGLAPYRLATQTLTLGGPTGVATTYNLYDALVAASGPPLVQVLGVAPDPATGMVFGMIVGQNGAAATFNQLGTGNVQVVAAPLILGKDASPSSIKGTYQMGSMGGSVFVTTATIVGMNGNGEFIQGSGTHGAGQLILGMSPVGTPGSGTYQLNAGQVAVGGETIVGWNGQGVFNNNGGSHTTDSLTLGRDATGNGTYLLGVGGTSGTLAVTNTITVSHGLLGVQGGQLSAANLDVGAAGLLAYSGGTITLGTSSNPGTLTVASGGSVHVDGTLPSSTPVTFYGGVNNYGTISLKGANITWVDPFKNGNAYIPDPSTSIFMSDLEITSDGYLVGGSGDIFEMHKGFLNYSDQTAKWNTSLAELRFIDGSEHPFGVSGDGSISEFAWGEIMAGAGVHLSFFDSTPGSPGMALWVGVLDLADHRNAILLDPGEILTIHYDPDAAANSWLNAEGGRNGVLTLRGSTLPPSVPEPGTLALLGLGLAGLAASRRRKQ